MRLPPQPAGAAPGSVAAARLTMSVIVPTYRRSADLARCLAALELQTHLPHEVAVVVREIDSESGAYLNGYRGPLPLKVLTIAQPGQVAALNLGIDETSGDIIAITDDDTAPRKVDEAGTSRTAFPCRSPGWRGGWPGLSLRKVVLVTALQPEWWDTSNGFGRRNTGGFHLGAGAPRLVGHLRGANMSFRRTAVGSIRFDPRLLGGGAQAANDWAFANAVRRAGWKLIYDPSVAVDHLCATQSQGDDRTARNPMETYSTVFNGNLDHPGRPRPGSRFPCACGHTCWAPSGHAGWRKSSASPSGDKGVG